MPKLHTGVLYLKLNKYKIISIFIDCMVDYIAVYMER